MTTTIPQPQAVEETSSVDASSWLPPFVMSLATGNHAPLEVGQVGVIPNRMTIGAR